MPKKFKVQPRIKFGAKLLFIVHCSLFTVFCLLSGCATTTDLDTLRSDVNFLKRETFELRKELNDLKEKTADVVKEDTFNAIREGQAEIHSRLSEISKDLQLLTGRFDENKYFIEKTLKDSATEKELIKTQIANIESQIKDIREKLNTVESQIKQQREPPKESEKKIEESKKEPQEQELQPSKSATGSPDKTALYEAAYNAFKDKKYKEAREKFEAFIKEFPKDELTDNAQFWVAETYYGEKDFEGAILAYETLFKKYPDSEKAPGALLKQGFSFIEIGDKKTGKIILEKLIERYPDSKEAESAKKKIEENTKKTEKKKR